MFSLSPPVDLVPLPRSPQLWRRMSFTGAGVSLLRASPFLEAGIRDIFADDAIGHSGGRADICFCSQAPFAACLHESRTQTSSEPPREPCHLFWGGQTRTKGLRLNARGPPLLSRLLSSAASDVRRDGAQQGRVDRRAISPSINPFVFHHKK